MRRTIAMGVVVALLGIPGGAWAAGRGNGRGKPEPMPCPEDVDAAVAAACPCEGTMAPDESVTPWRNHGQYVRCVVKYRNQLKKSGCVASDERREMARCAARSTCGKADRVLCCITTTGTCDDAAPNGVPEGLCSNDQDVGCDTDADCTESQARVTDGEVECDERGGTVTGAGSVCAPCSPAAPQPE
jgi:hypothetical protein